MVVRCKERAAAASLGLRLRRRHWYAGTAFCQEARRVTPDSRVVEPARKVSLRLPAILAVCDRSFCVNDRRRTGIRDSGVAAYRRLQKSKRFVAPSRRFRLAPGCLSFFERAAEIGDEGYVQRLLCMCIGCAKDGSRMIGDTHRRSGRVLQGSLLARSADGDFLLKD